MKSVFQFLLFFLGLLAFQSLKAQSNVGINTISPDHSLEMEDAGDQYLRLHHRANSNKRVEMEFVRGEDGAPGNDWKLSKVVNDLRFVWSDNNFATYGTERMRILANGNIGIGTSFPATKLHITGGENATNTGDGYMMLGSKLGVNLVMDNNAILTRSNGSPAGLYLQADGGHTRFGLSGNTNTLIPNGKLSIGGYSTNARVNIDHDLWQIQLNNWENSQNNWFIGASNGSWLAGDDQLLFSPTSSSDDAVFRLMDIADNDGVNAPVILYTSEDHVLLLDGNEIDTRQAPLYFNFNTEEHTLFNVNGGKVGIGTNNPIGQLHIESPAGFDLTLQNGSAYWSISSHENGNVHFFSQGILRGYISYNGGGNWVAISDERLKHDILPLQGAMQLIDQLSVKKYQYKLDSEKEQHIGLIAQEAQEVIPEAVFVDDETYGINYDQVTVLAIKGIQEQQERLMDIDRKLDSILDSME